MQHHQHARNPHATLELAAYAIALCVQLEASAALLDAEGNARGAASTREQAADKRAVQQQASTSVEALQARQEALQQRFQALSAAFQRSELKLGLQELEAVQWTAAVGLMQARLLAPSHYHMLLAINSSW